MQHTHAQTQEQTQLILWNKHMHQPQCETSPECVFESEWKSRRRRVSMRQTNEQKSVALSLHFIATWRAARGGGQAGTAWWRADTGGWGGRMTGSWELTQHTRCCSRQAWGKDMRESNGFQISSDDRKRADVCSGGSRQSALLSRSGFGLSVGWLVGRSVN